MKRTVVTGMAMLVASLAFALPEGWTESRRAGVTEWSSPQAAALLPVEWTVQFRVATGAYVTVSAVAASDVKPLVEAQVRAQDGGRLQCIARSSGALMETDIRSGRNWGAYDKASGSLPYTWRFPVIRNLWDEVDRREIGAAYDGLVPLQEKLLTLRVVLRTGLRQVWLDDRLVAEAAAANPLAAALRIVFRDAAVEEVAMAPSPDPGLFLPLPLTAWSHARTASPSLQPGQRVELAGPAAAKVPMLVPPEGAVDIDLGASLYRFRSSNGSGPDAPYVNANHAWPGPFEIDPASLTFRIPYRPWQAAWLLAWVDDEKGAVPRGVFRFYRQEAGYPADTPFEISDAAIRAGTVVKLDRQGPGGKPLYLVRVPVETDGFYGFRDLANQFLMVELTKPLALSRSFPDPIYYGLHPAGPPSSIHVVGITLEEAPFDYEVRPLRLGHVYQRPEKAAYSVSVRNRTSQPLDAKVILGTTSFDGSEGKSMTGTVSLAAREVKDASLSWDPALNGWHELRVRVEAAGVVRTNTLSLVMLPPDTRTRGVAANETRFGAWTLWGHYIPFQAGAFRNNAAWLEVLGKLGVRRMGGHIAFMTTNMLAEAGMLPKGSHTVSRHFSGVNVDDPEAMARASTNELAQVADGYGTFPESTYFYGGEWHIGREIQYAPWPRYTGDGDRPLNEEELKNVARHIKIFTAIGKGMRAQYPKAKLYLQWGAPLGTLAYLKAGFPRELVDGFGMDAPMFELMPENPVGVGSIQSLWGLRTEAARMGWTNLPIAWCEGPFFPTCPGALTEREQAAYQIRYWLAALSYNVQNFEAGVVDFDAGNYYGAEHYGAGVFHRLPLENPKPAVAAIATATAMLCGADPAGGVDTGVPTTACMAFRHAASRTMRYALWRVSGKAKAVVRVSGGRPVLTDAMGNARELVIENGEVVFTVDESPVWLTTGAEGVASVRVESPEYTERPAAVTRPLPAFTAKLWQYDGKLEKAITNRHFALRRIPEPALSAVFEPGEEGHPDIVSVVLPEGPVDKPLAQRCGILRPRRPAAIPGKPSALGVWVKGNGSWGRIVYRIRDARGEVWSSTGTRDDWNCDDTHGWSYIHFEGWRYVRFPLPGVHPWDGAREAETVWWGSLGGDAVPEPPYTLLDVVVEARNEVPVAGEMRVVPVREVKLSGLVAEYAQPDDVLPGAATRHAKTMPVPEWKGPTRNPIAELTRTGVREAPAIGRFDEPEHFNDGRRMIIRFQAQPDLTYNLYLSREESGAGAELLKAKVTDGMTVAGLRPDTPMFLFLISVAKDKSESKPSRPHKLVTRDNFAEK